MPYYSLKRYSRWKPELREERNRESFVRMSRLFLSHRYIINRAEARSEGWRQNTRPADGSTGAKIKFQTNFYSKMKFWILSKSRNNSWVSRLLFFKNNELIYYYRKTFKKQVLFFVPSEAWRCCNSWFCFFRVRRELAPNLVKITKYKLKLFYLV